MRKVGRMSQEEEQEIPMGPMIDMVFLLLIFFMVTAKPIKPEADISLSLPGTVAQSEPVELPDEQQIVILADGSVVLNDLVMGAADDRTLQRLHGTLLRFRESAEAGRSRPLVTLAPDDAATHQRIVDVLDVCARARITGVTFAAPGEESGP